MVVCGTEQVSPECIKITSDAGLAFFIRKSYLKIVKIQEIVSGAEFFEEAEKDIVDAGLVMAVESKAMEYLARAEQSRFGLTRKLILKNFSKEHIEIALDYLEAKNYLSDERFARAWLNCRKIAHFEGRIKLSAELSSRGINKDIVKSSLDTFFEENSEEEICQKAYEKCLRQKKSEEKIIRTLVAYGFSHNMIKKIISANKE